MDLIIKSDIPNYEEVEPTLCEFFHQQESLKSDRASSFDGEMSAVSTQEDTILSPTRSLRVENYPLAVDPPLVLDEQEPIPPHFPAVAGHEPRPENPLRHFFDTPKRKKKAKGKSNKTNAPRAQPKMEYFRTKLIRGQKRNIRKVMENKVPRTTINKVNTKNQKQNAAWVIYKVQTENNMEELNKVAATNSGPLTDGGSLHKQEYGKDFKKILNAAKTFNNGFCEEYFLSDAVRQNFVLYVDVLFEGMTPEDLCQKFKFKCCLSDHHSKSCEEHWSSLCRYAKNILIKGKINNRSDRTPENLELNDCEDFLE
jgi:hypothetical protein